VTTGVVALGLAGRRAAAAWPPAVDRQTPGTDTDPFSISTAAQTEPRIHGAGGPAAAVALAKTVAASG
jgi:hypothetical protein